jgi:2-keto-4-pentenoate hydratase/2-oxohepta-3-ene-1,7-dioic acid hydratase in catechol pathway
VRDFVAFEEHVEGVRKAIDGVAGVVPEWYQAPTFYFTNPYALIGAHDDVAVPPGSKRFDFELEVAVVVGAVPGSDGASLTPEQAREHVFGYSVLNDWSARDLQGREMRVNLGPAKGKDSATTLGPWLVTADELEPYRDDEGFLALDMRVSVNGTEIGQDLLSNMGWPFEELIAYASRGTEVRAGDVLGSGTCGNGGCLAELWGTRGDAAPPPLQPGDVVEMTVEGLGTIRNRVVPGIELPPVAPARPRPRTRKRPA